MFNLLRKRSDRKGYVERSYTITNVGKISDCYVLAVGSDVAHILALMMMGGAARYPSRYPVMAWDLENPLTLRQEQAQCARERERRTQTERQTGRDRQKLFRRISVAKVKM